MKKLTAIFLALILILTMSAPALAAKEPPSEAACASEEPSSKAAPATVENDEVFEAAETDFADSAGGARIADEPPRLSDGTAGKGDITSPLDYWNINGWPDDVSFAYDAGGEMSSDGTILDYWEIGLVNASEARRQEIVHMFAATCLITFHEAAWSHSQREDVLFEIEMEVKELHDSNFVGGMLVSNTDKIIVTVKDDVFEEYSARYAEQYGELVQTQRESEMAVVTVYTAAGELGTLEGSKQTKKNTLFLPILICAVMLASAAMLWINRFRLVPAKQTASGAVVSDAKPLTRGQTVHAVRESTYSPGDRVLESIRDELKR